MRLHLRVIKYKNKVSDYLRKCLLMEHELHPFMGVFAFINNELAVINNLRSIIRTEYVGICPEQTQDTFVKGGTL